jgi:hypothetical protein
MRVREFDKTIIPLDSISRSEFFAEVYYIKPVAKLPFCNFNENAPLPLSRVLQAAQITNIKNNTAHSFWTSLLTNKYGVSNGIYSVISHIKADSLTVNP